MMINYMNMSINLPLNEMVENILISFPVAFYVYICLVFIGAVFIRSKLKN